MQKVDVVRDTGAPHLFQAGMNVRIAPNGVDVLADLYLGPGGLLEKFVRQFYGAEYRLRQSVAGGSFTLDLLIDYSPALKLAPQSFYTRVEASGNVSGGTLPIRLLRRDFQPDAQGQVVERDRDEVVLVCGAGTDLPDLVAVYEVADIKVLADTGLPHSIRNGQRLVTQDGGVTELFGNPFVASEFERRFPEFQIQQLMSLVGNGVAQGFIAFQARDTSVVLQAIGEFGFYHTGTFMQGELQMVWRTAVGQETDHVYLVLQPVTEGPAELAREFVDWLLLDPEIFERVRAH